MRIKMKTIIIIFLCVLAYNPAQAVVDTLEWEYMGSPGYGDCINFGINSKGHYFFCGKSSLERSTDGGQSWKILRINRGESYQRIQFDSEDNIYYLETPFENFFLFSSDNGNNWDSIDVSIDNKDVTLYNIFVIKTNELLVFVRNNKLLNIIRSFDKGKSWEKVFFPTITASNVGYSCFANKNGDMAVNVKLGDKLSHIYLKLDNDTTWRELVYEIENITYIHIVSSNEFYIATTRGMYYTDSGGDTLRFIGPDSTYEKNYINTAYFPNEQEIYIGRRSGLAYSPDKGKSWVDLDDKFSDYTNPYSPTSTQIRVVTGDNSGNIYAAPEFCGMFVSSNKGADWKDIGGNLNSTLYLGTTFDKAGDLYSFARGIKKSTDYGKTWQMLGFKEYWYGRMYCTSKGVLLASNRNGVMKSTDNGETWTVTKKGLAEENSSSPRFSRIVENKKGTLFGKYDDYNITARSFDEGDSWEARYDSAGGANLAINPNDDLFILSAGQGVVYRSQDDAMTWKRVSSDMGYGSQYATKLVMHPKGRSGFAYFGDFSAMTTNNGDYWMRILGNMPPNEPFVFVDSSGRYCFFSEDRILCCNYLFTNWDTIYNVGLKHQGYHSPFVSPDGHFYVFAQAGGVYRSMKKYLSADNSSKSISTKLHLETLPNPIFSEAEITYATHTAGRTKLVLYNLLGIPVAMLTDTHHEAGRHTARLSATNIPAGAYFLRLESGGESVAKAVWVAR